METKVYTVKMHKNVAAIFNSREKYKNNAEMLGAAYKEAKRLMKNKERKDKLNKLEIFE